MKQIPINKTSITIAGVYRCCLATIGTEYKEASVGAESKCRHCDTVFRLTENAGEYLWKPVRQIEREV